MCCMSSWCNKWPATNLTQLSLETISCAICKTCSFLKLVDIDGRCKPPFACDRNRMEELAHLARPAHVLIYKVGNGSSWHLTHEIGSWITIRSHASLGETPDWKVWASVCVRCMTDRPWPLGLVTFDTMCCLWWLSSSVLENGKSLLNWAVQVAIWCIIWQQSNHYNAATQPRRYLSNSPRFPQLGVMASGKDQFMLQLVNLSEHWCSDPLWPSHL